jgi:hypothetical protein
VYHGITQRNRAEADAGRFLLGWVRAAGFEIEYVGSSTWTFADPDSRHWGGDLWADRVLLSSYAEQALDYGLADKDELAQIADAWRRWSEEPDGFFAVLHGEVIGRA